MTNHTPHPACVCEKPDRCSVAEETGYCHQCGGRLKNLAALKENSGKISSDKRLLRAKFERLKRDVLARFQEIEEEFDRMV